MSEASSEQNTPGNRPPVFPIPMDFERLETHSAERKESRDRALLRFSLIAFFGDTLAAILGLLFAWYLRTVMMTEAEFTLEALSHWKDYIPQYLLGSVVLVVMLINFGLYNARYLMRIRKNVVSIIQVIFYWGIGFLFLSLALKIDPPISRVFVAIAMLTVLGGLITWRWAYATYLINSVFSDQFRKRVLAVGWNKTAQELYEKIYSDPRHPISIYSAVTTVKGDFEERPPNEVIVEGDYQHLSELLSTRRFDAVLLVDFNLTPKQILEVQQIAMREMTEFMAIPSFYQVLLSRLEFDSIGGIPVMTGHNLPLNNVFNAIVKRGFDVVGSIFGLLAASPIIAYFCLRVYSESPGPVFFKQERIGKNGKRFKMYKIRSMKLDADKLDHLNQSTLREDPRMLKVGELMRRLNIDELPQFWNVLKGDMSLVGPRPERKFHVSKLKYDINNYNLRHAVKPGVTGWAAINGWRGDTDLNTRIAFDIEYMEKWSIWFDIYIMLKTLNAGKNAY